MKTSFKLSDDSFFAMASLIGQLWSFKELQHNPMIYLSADARFHARVDRQVRMDALQRKITKLHQKIQRHNPHSFKVR